tara:strand:- start:210 stop:602 length:393 start_codon:yes stop_codon:yes gene_type:complete
MNSNLGSNYYLITDDPRFKEGLTLFNSGEWYLAHDLLEELWHETNGPERRTIQGILQIAVAQIHLESGNSNGATILYGEGIGRLKRDGTPELGIDIKKLCEVVDCRLKLLQQKIDPINSELPFLFSKSTE